MTPFRGNNRVTSPFGYREYWNSGRLVKELHRGVDVVCTAFAGQAVAQSAWTVREVTGGKVLRVAYDTQRGHFVEVQTQPDTFERYQHLARVQVRVGQMLTQGTPIGVAGSTGNSTGVHLHFGVYRGGANEANAVEPSAWLGLPNRAGKYAGSNALDGAGGAQGGAGGGANEGAAQQPSAGADASTGNAPQTGSALAVLHIGPASVGDRKQLAALATALCLPLSETAV